MGVADGSAFIKAPTGKVTSAPFIDVCALTSLDPDKPFRALGSNVQALADSVKSNCSNIQETVDGATLKAIFNDSIFTCYDKGAQPNHAIGLTGEEVPYACVDVNAGAAGGRDSVPVKTWYAVIMKSELSGSFEIWTEGTGKDMNPGGVNTGDPNLVTKDTEYPCCINPTNHWFVDVSVAQGAGKCTTAPPVPLHAVASSLERCDGSKYDVPAGIQCNVVCEVGYLEVGNLVCQKHTDGTVSWTKSFSCSQETCDLPSRANSYPASIADGISGVAPPCYDRTSAPTSCHYYCAQGLSPYTIQCVEPPKQFMDLNPSHPVGKGVWVAPFGAGCSFTVPPTPAPPTALPTAVPGSPAPPTPVPWTPVPLPPKTPVPPTPVPRTPVPLTPAPPTPIPRTPAPPTPAPPTPAPPTPAPPAPPTPPPRTPVPPIPPTQSPPAPPTRAPETLAPPTVSPPTPGPPAPTTPVPTPSSPAPTPSTPAPPTPVPKPPQTPQPPVITPTGAPPTASPPHAKTQSPDTPTPPVAGRTQSPDTPPGTPTTPPGIPTTTAPDGTRAPGTSPADSPAPPNPNPTDTQVPPGPDGTQPPTGTVPTPWPGIPPTPRPGVLPPVETDIPGGPPSLSDAPPDHQVQTLVPPGQSGLPVDHRTLPPGDTLAPGQTRSPDQGVGLQETPVPETAAPDSGGGGFPVIIIIIVVVVLLLLGVVAFLLLRRKRKRSVNTKGKAIKKFEWANEDAFDGLEMGDEKEEAAGYDYSMLMQGLDGEGLVAGTPDKPPATSAEQSPSNTAEEKPKKKKPKKKHAADVPLGAEDDAQLDATQSSSAVASASASGAAAASQAEAPKKKKKKKKPKVEPEPEAEDEDAPLA